ncbi:unnamed protein product [Prorocentrum cordatum]|uniref:Spindle pole body component n=1 Tax=Prorocentrum cordatum TaxID=2364126 RepID=A0ABN9R2W1_9DINO|nr:unnamed protein product [Polarella glacialis]
MSLPTFGAWNVVYWLALGSHFLKERTADDMCDIASWRIILQVEAPLAAALLLISRSVRGVMEGEAQQQVEACSSRSGLGAAKSLLGTLCDAVVELDGSLKLQGHSPSLSTLLLHGSGHGLGGAQFDQFMYTDEDKARLYSCVRNTLHETDAIADAVHVKMRDCLGNAIDMELFHVCFWDSLREVPQHLVGLREHSDLLATPQRLPEHPMQVDPISSQETQAIQPELAVVFNALTFKILQCSWAFVARFGEYPASTSLTDWLPPSDPHLGVFCENVNNFANSDEEASFFELGPLNLRLPGADQAGTHASFTLSRPRCGDEAEPQIVACMVLATGQGGPHSRSYGPSCGSRYTAPDAANPGAAVPGTAHTARGLPLGARRRTRGPSASWAAQGRTRAAAVGAAPTAPRRPSPSREGRLLSGWRARRSLEAGCFWIPRSQSTESALLSQESMCFCCLWFLSGRAESQPTLSAFPFSCLYLLLSDV